MTKSLRFLLLLPCIAAIGAEARATNQLGSEPSAFLKSFASSPVNWMPWGEAAIARAKAEQKPVFVFVGSFTSELAGAMRRQTFANAKSSDWLNKNFVCVIVDRDERPDVAAQYEGFVGSLKQMTGWPLNVWLTPDFQPYEGATYLSPSEDWGAPGFLKLANEALSAWKTNPASCRKRATDSIAQMAPIPSSPAGPWNPDKLRSRLATDAAAWRATFDPVQGGFGDVPRGLEPELVRFMLLQSADDKVAAQKTLRAIAASAVRDPLDGGFFRHASDGAWHIPYQQKTVTDQARVALAFLAGAEGPDAASFGECARGALDYALTRLSHPDGTLASSEDATGDEFARYYAWSAAEIDAALGPDAAAFKSAHGVEAAGNVPAGDDPSSIFAQKNLLRSTAETSPALRAAAARLLAVRDQRGSLPRDDRATAGAHGLMINALARAGLQLNEPRYLEAAHRILDAVTRDFVVSPDGALRRFKGSETPAYADDYAALALGCRGLARAAKDDKAMELSGKFLQQLDSRFYDASSSSYFGAGASPGPGFFVRPFTAGDPPSVESLALLAHSQNSKQVASTLLQFLEDSSAQAPGDQLLAMQIFGTR